MKNLLILIVAIAIFLHFYPQPELTAWYEEQKTKVLAMFSDATDTHVRLNPHKIYQDVEASFGQFSGEEQKFVKELTETRENVKEFFSNYCEQKKNHARLHHTNQKIVCDKIAPYQSLF